MSFNCFTALEKPNMALELLELKYAIGQDGWLVEIEIPQNMYDDILLTNMQEDIFMDWSARRPSSQSKSFGIEKFWAILQTSSWEGNELKWWDIRLKYVYTLHEHVIYEARQDENAEIIYCSFLALRDSWRFTNWYDFLHVKRPQCRGKPFVSNLKKEVSADIMQQDKMNSVMGNIHAHIEQQWFNDTPTRLEHGKRTLSTTLTEHVKCDIRRMEIAST